MPYDDPRKAADKIKVQINAMLHDEELAGYEPVMVRFPDQASGDSQRGCRSCKRTGDGTVYNLGLFKRRMTLTRTTYWAIATLCTACKMDGERVRKLVDSVVAIGAS